MQLANLKNIGNILFKGSIIEAAPQIAAGMLVQFLRNRNIGVKEASEWVVSNKTLWDMLEPKYQDYFRKMAQRLNGNIEWITAEWAIDACREELPTLASLFLGWKKANNWLVRQIVIIRQNVV